MAAQREVLAAMADDFGTETGWLIEETWSGYVHYIHHTFDAARWRAEANSIDDKPYEWVPTGVSWGMTLTRRKPTILFITKDANEALRFPTKGDADVWIAAQPDWFNHGDQYQAREHMWPELTIPQAVSMGDNRSGIHWP